MLVCSQKKGRSVSSYIDLRLIGSNQSIYGDPLLPTTERATRLIVDVLIALGQTLQTIAIQGLENGLDAHVLLPRLDDMSTVFSDVKVIGQQSETRTDKENSGLKRSRSLNLSKQGPNCRCLVNLPMAESKRFRSNHLVPSIIICPLAGHSKHFPVL